MLNTLPPKKCPCLELELVMPACWGSDVLDLAALPDSAALGSEDDLSCEVDPSFVSLKLLPGKMNFSGHN